jgi:hypothetical protein
MIDDGWVGSVWSTGMFFGKVSNSYSSGLRGNQACVGRSQEMGERHSTIFLFLFLVWEKGTLSLAVRLQYINEKQTLPQDDFSSSCFHCFQNGT